MHRVSISFVLAVSFLLIIGSAFAQGATANETATCNFDTDKQLAIEYQGVTLDSKKKVLGTEVPYGKVWAPGNKPMTMFANTPVSVGNTALPVGAYTLFVIPEEKTWTLVISKSTDTSGKYDEKDDFARIPMKCGTLPQAEPQFSVYFAHVAPKQCNARFDLQNARAWIDIKEGK